MILQAKIALSLLVAACNLNVVHPGQVGSVTRRLYENNIEYSATASSGAGIHSLTAENELVNEGREMPQISKADGSGLLGGKRSNPLGKKISVPNHFENDEEMIKAMNMEYGTLVLLLSELPPRLTDLVLQECGLSEKAFLVVLQELRDYHETYMLKSADDTQEALEIAHDSQKARSGMLTDLTRILHSITFKRPSEYAERDDISHMRATLDVKTTFERSVFKTLGYLYRFKLIDQNEMSSFFDDPETLQRTARHLLDLYSGHKWTFTAYYTFVPELKFILNDWHTEHLHLCLKDLGKRAQRDLIHETLKSTSQDFENLLAPKPDQLQSHASRSVNKFVSQEDFLPNLAHFSSRDLELNPEVLWPHIADTLDLFQSPNVKQGFQAREETKLTLNLEKINLLLHYYTLKFIMEFGSEKLKEKINAYKLHNQVSQLRLQFTTCGLEFQQLVNKYHDYGYFHTYPQEARNIIQTHISRENRVKLREQMSSLLTEFLSLKGKLDSMRWGSPLGQDSFGHDALSQALINLSNQKYEKPHWNSWLIRTEDNVDVNNQISPGKVKLN